MKGEVDLAETLKELLTARRVLQETMMSFGMKENPGVTEVLAHLDFAVLDLREVVIKAKYEN